MTAPLSESEIAEAMQLAQESIGRADDAGRLARCLLQCAADARRYRRLRDQRLTGNPAFTTAMGWPPESLSSDQVDAAIDSAMKASHD